MKVKKNLFILLIIIFSCLLLSSQELDLSKEYSMDEFQNGIRSFHNTEYEQSITYFIKALSFKDDNHIARFFLGESYRKAGYERNAIFTWSNLLSLGYDDNTLKGKIAYLYNKRGILSEININKNYIISEDIKGYYNETTPPTFLKPSQIYVDEDNHYYIASYLTGKVLELDSNFVIVKNHFTVTEELKKPFGVAVDKEGFIYVSDFERDIVVKMDRLGIIKKKIGFKGIGNGGLLGPQYLLFDDEENLYVVDSGNHRINKYSKDGDILFSFGTKKNGDGNLVKPAGMLYYDNKIYVCDKEDNRVLIFDKNGNYIGSFGEDKLDKPYGIVRDRYNRFLILCEKKIWAYEDEFDLWYIMDAPGKRLKKGISIAIDKNYNVLVTDFNTSRLLVFSHERGRYTNLNLNIERVYSGKFPDVNVLITTEFDDFKIPKGLNERNFSVFENGKMVPYTSTALTTQRNRNSDIIVIYDKNEKMVKHAKDFRTIMNGWLTNKNSNTSVCFISIKENEAILENNFDSSRLSILDSIDNTVGADYTDKGAGIKFGLYHALSRFSKKAVVLITDANETGNDFEKFNVDNCIGFARNNNIPIYIVSFDDGNLVDIYKYLSKKTGGDYYRVYKNTDLYDLFKRIEDSDSKELVLSYESKAVSRFGEEPIVLTIEVDYNGMKGVSKNIYYPSNMKSIIE